MKQKYIIPLTFAFMIIFSFGYYMGIKFTDQRLTPSEIADNIEYLAISDNVPYSYILHERTLDNLVGLYKTSNIGEVSNGRTVLEYVGYRLCNKNLAGGSSLEEIPLGDNNISLNKFMFCLLEEDDGN